LEKESFYHDYKDVAWCPGCGNFAIRKALTGALDELEISPSKTVFTSGIGQAAKMPQYINGSFFNGLHGRALPPATAIKACNPDLTVISEGGDGDMYGEGGNHLIHCIRRNPDMTLLVHDNMVYGLTKGQASPTTQIGMVTPVQVFGVFEEPVNPLALAISLDASFVARANAGDIDKTKEIIKKAVQHKGFSLVDIFQSCVSFNKLNTFGWFKEHTYYLDEQYDPENRAEAFKKAIEKDPYPLGVIYINNKKIPFEDNLMVYKKDKTPLYERARNIKDIGTFIKNKYQ
jgi:2-oxoglutarate/2-oxoacid ferredoxin oxidoreductase subunit beta